MNDSYLKAIGRVVVNFQSMEMTLKTSVVMLTNIDYFSAQLLTAQMGFEQLTTLICDLSERKFRHDEEMLQSIENSFKDINTIKKKRNDIMHSYWLEDSVNKDLITKYRMNKRDTSPFMGEMKEYSADEINSIADEISTVHKNFWNTLRLAIKRMKENETEQLRQLDEQISKEIHVAAQEQIDKLKS